MRPDGKNLCPDGKNLRPDGSFGVPRAIQDLMSDKYITAGEVLEAIFTGQDSDNENYDCGSDTESIVNDESNSASEESDLDDSITLPNETSSQTIESVSGALKGNFYS